MATTLAAERPAEQPKARWSLGLPEEDAVDGAPTDDSPRDPDQPESPTEVAEITADERTPDPGERDELKDSSEPMEGGRT